MPVILTSFKRIKTLKRYLGFLPKVFSVARYQPKHSKWPELKHLAPPENIISRMEQEGFRDFLKLYEGRIRQAYKDNWPSIESWLVELNREETIVLACWCPYTEQARQQLRDFGRFACHTGLIGKMLNKHRPDIEVWLDGEHRKLVPEWIPEYTRIIGLKPHQKNLFPEIQLAKVRTWEAMAL